MANQQAPINPPINRPPEAEPFNILKADIATLTPEQLQHRRNLLETIDIERKNSERDETERLQRVAREANIQSVLEATKKQERDQASCPHLKPRNMGTALAGQKTHRGWYTYVCQYCGKQFSSPPQKPGEEVPPHLYPDPAMVGGPHQ